MEFDLALPVGQVTRVLDEAMATYVKPVRIRTDNGPEFTSKVFDAWAYAHGIQHPFIRPGKPVENAFAESLNGRIRDEFLNQHYFQNVRDACDLRHDWHDDYNEIRPHTALGGLGTEQFIAERRGPSGSTPLRASPTHLPSQAPGSLLSPPSSRNDRTDKGGCLIETLTS